MCLKAMYLKAMLKLLIRNLMSEIFSYFVLVFSNLRINDENIELSGLDH